MYLMQIRPSSKSWPIKKCFYFWFAFIIAANKVDRIPGWKSNPDQTMAVSLKSQQRNVIKDFDNLIYDIMGELSRHGKIEADRFDRVKGSELTKKVIIIPTSAKTGEGIPELFMFLTGLSQRFLKDKIVIMFCPKLDTTIEHYIEKLAAIFKQHNRELAT